MKPLRKLVSQTAIYGLSSIFGRFLNYLLVPLYTYTFSAAEYGVVSEFYAYAGFFAVVLVLGLETGYFRFRQNPQYATTSVYAAALGFVTLFNGLILIAACYWRQTIADWLHYPQHADYIICFAVILALDAITALPFAKLRAENRAWRFAGIKIAEILLTIALNLFFLLACPQIQKLWPDSLVGWYYQPHLGVTYIFWSNLIASFCKTLWMMPEFSGIRLLPPRVLWPMLIYSLPMVITGFAGMINEMLDRVILKQLLPYDLTTNLKLLGIYGACYKLSILMSLFVQAFRYAAEPFFFAYAGREDAQRTYALVMQYFVMAGMLIFLLVSLFLDFFQYFIGAEFRDGLAVVPILLLANLCLGIYINLSVWYKLSDRTGLGAWVSVCGAALTVVLNILWIPTLGYMGSAWATLACYALMVVLSWLLSRRYYPINYPLAKISYYCLIGLGCFFGNRYGITTYGWSSWLSGSACLFAYILATILLDARMLLQVNK